MADIVTAQLSQYEMTHGERPAVHVAANMLEGIVYQNKCVPPSLSFSWKLPTDSTHAHAGTV